MGNDSVEANRGLVYLQYVDTTGCFVPRGQQREVTQALVLGYLGFCEAAGFVRCHIFARQNPHYLFAGSEKNLEKKGLSARQVRRILAQLKKKKKKNSNGRVVATIPLRLEADWLVGQDSVAVQRREGL